MAVTKIWPVKGQLEHPINYAMNPEKTMKPEEQINSDEMQSLQDVMNYAVNEEKTEKQFYVSGINCNPYTARNQFMTVKKEFDKEGGIVAYHAYQSFSENEVTPDVAHQIGIEFAEKLWGEDYQVVVATHLNTHCLHNHFVVNSVSFRHGRRCQTKQWNELSRVSDEICRLHELSVIEHPIGKRLPYPVIMAEKNGESTRLAMVRKAVDEAISQSCNMREFHQSLKALGYACQFQPNRKYWTVQQKNWKRPMRLYRLGDDYSNDRILERVLETPTAVRTTKYQDKSQVAYHYHLQTRLDKIKKIGGLRGLYLHYCYKLGYLPKYKQNPNKVHYLLRDDLLKLNQISEETKLLCQENIQTGKQLFSYKESLAKQLTDLDTQRNDLRNLIRRVGIDPAMIADARDKISTLSDDMKEIRRKVKLCEGIENRSSQIEEKMKKIRDEEKERDRKER